MKRLTFIFTSLFAAFLTTGCITHVAMTRVDPNDHETRGLRVNLPAPFVVGRQNPTNSSQTDYDVEMLPDPKQEYAITYWTFAGKQKVAIKRSLEMYLNQVDLNQDSTAVATALIGAAGQMGQASGQSQSSGGGGQKTTTTTTSQTTSGNSAQATPNQGASTQPNTSTTTKTETSPTDSKSSASLPGPIQVVYRIVETTGGEGGTLMLQQEKFQVLNFDGAAPRTNVYLFP